MGDGGWGMRDAGCGMRRGCDPASRIPHLAQVPNRGYQNSILRALGTRELQGRRSRGEPLIRFSSVQLTAPGGSARFLHVICPWIVGSPLILHLLPAYSVPT